MDLVNVLWYNVRLVLVILVIEDFGDNLGLYVE